MKKELEDQLFEKYPKIFRQKDLPMTQTAMCWRFDGVPDSWYTILDVLCGLIQCHVDSGKISQVEATQVKEKFGSARFYTNTCDEVIDAYIEFAEWMTGRICSRCGSDQDVSCKKTGWVNYLCANCQKDKK